MAPAAWRLLGAIREEDPETGGPVQHRRAVDTRGVMLTNGTITPEMHEAGAIFRRQFRVAALDALRAVPLLRIPGGGGGDRLTERHVDARRKIAAALDALGGHDSAAGSCV